MLFSLPLLYISWASFPDGVLFCYGFYRGVPFFVASSQGIIILDFPTDCELHQAWPSTLAFSRGPGLQQVCHKPQRKKGEREGRISLVILDRCPVSISTFEIVAITQNAPLPGQSWSGWNQHQPLIGSRQREGVFFFASTDPSLLSLLWVKGGDAGASGSL